MKRNASRKWSLNRRNGEFRDIKKVESGDIKHVDNFHMSDVPKPNNTALRVLCNYGTGLRVKSYWQGTWRYLLLHTPPNFTILLYLTWLLFVLHRMSFAPD